jgi:hypothetical protein
MRQPNPNPSQGTPESLVETLQKKVGRSARVQDCYGGVRIIINEPGRFPWQVVLETLLERQDEVWLRREKGAIEIVSQSPSP